MNAPQTLQSDSYFDEAWLARLEWHAIDHDGELSRWRVRDPHGNRQWLIMRASVRASLWELARLDREYALGPCLGADWAVMPLARLSTADGVVLVLDNAHGAPLSAFASKPLSVERLLRLAIASAAALDRNHRNGLLHRDIRPSNLMLDEDGLIRLTGFASAILPSGCSEDIPALPDGSLAYHAPEQAASVQSDLYALGVSLFELLTGHLPFNASDPVQWQHQHVAVAAPTLGKYRPGLPAALDDLLARLLAKDPLQRPATAQQLEAELRRCLDEWREVGSIHRSAPQALAKPPQALIGRGSELAVLRAAFARLQQGLGGALLIGGEAGIGKTSLVRQFTRDLGGAQVLLANGKCELARHNVPYAALSTALASLFTRLAGESPENVRRWGQQLREALGHDGSTLTRMIPELGWLTGPLLLPSNPPGISEARRHLHGLLQRLLGVLANSAHPLILFLDDVQWLDEETQSFISELAPSSFDHLLLVAAYRNDEALPGAPLSALIAHCRTLGARTAELSPRPLTGHEVATLLSTELDLHPAERELLAERISKRSNGNPLYVTQFVAMQEEAASNGASLQLQPLLDDVAALLDSRLGRLPERTRELLCTLAILGNQTPLEDLAAVTGTAVPYLLNLLRPAFQAGLVGESHCGLSFTHDTVW
ncbi:MAG TPA: AAA family ATPase, partial [Chitinolyticbacter sp.]|nr:AAA family ATPase [Chitinolyticbacter sp.]